MDWISKPSLGKAVALFIIGDSTTVILWDSRVVGWHAYAVAAFFGMFTLFSVVECLLILIDEVKQTAQAISTAIHDIDFMTPEQKAAWGAGLERITHPETTIVLSETSGPTAYRKMIHKIKCPPDKLRLLALGLLEGAPFSEGRWAPVLGTTLVRELQPIFLARGYVTWKRYGRTGKPLVKQGYSKLTPVGKAAMRYVLRAYPMPELLDPLPNFKPSPSAPSPEVV